jgi:hypothetical protein
MAMLKRDWGRVPKEADEQGRYRCSRCREWKSPDNYNKNRNQTSGLNYMCRPCSTTSSRKYGLPAKYNITVARFAEMLLAQGGKCACCTKQFVTQGKTMDRPCVDHNHKTKEVRSLLCGRCNIAAGNVLDSSDKAAQLADYLKKWGC